MIRVEQTNLFWNREWYNSLLVKYYHLGCVGLKCGESGKGALGVFREGVPLYIQLLILSHQRAEGCQDLDVVIVALVFWKSSSCLTSLEETWDYIWLAIVRIWKWRAKLPKGDGEKRETETEKTWDAGTQRLTGKWIRTWQRSRASRVPGRRTRMSWVRLLRWLGDLP